jgi:hypothetical protein
MNDSRRVWPLIADHYYESNIASRRSCRVRVAPKLLNENVRDWISCFMYGKACGLLYGAAETREVYPPCPAVVNCLAIDDGRGCIGQHVGICGLVIRNCGIRLPNEANGIDPRDVPREKSRHWHARRFRADRLT